MSIARNRSHIGIKRIALLAGLTVALLPTLATAAGDPNAGRIKAVSCQVCHGEGGKSTNTLYPILAGQHAQYLARQMRHFKSKERVDAVMNEMMQGLSDKDIEDLASYFASVKD